MRLALILLSVLTAQSGAFAINVQAQPITAASPFEQLTQGPQQSQQPQWQGLQVQSQQQATGSGLYIELLSSRFIDDQFGGEIVGEIMNMEQRLLR